MPTVASFNGVTIIFRIKEHPPPHFHAFHGDDEAVIGLGPVALLRGHLPAARLREVLAWAQRHQTGLAANWQRCQSLNPVHQIAYP